MSLDLDSMDRSRNGHAVWAPSSADGFATCEAFIQANIGRPDDAGIDAAWGTIAHSFLEEWVSKNAKPAYRVGKVETAEAGGDTFEITIDDEMVEAAQECFSRVAGISGDRYTETKVYFDNLTPIDGQGGTADLAFCAPKLLRIFDWKFGKGVPVRVENNYQLMLYAYGFFREWDWLYNFQTIELNLFQPRLDYFGTWTISRDELYEFAIWIQGRMWRNTLASPTRTPTLKGCRWCRDKTCVGKAAMLDDIADQSFDLEEDGLSNGDDYDKEIVTYDAKTQLIARQNAGNVFDPPKPRDLSTKRLVAIRGKRRLIETFLSDVNDELMRRADAGEDVPGWKVVEGKSRQYFTTEQEAVDWLDTIGVDPADVYVRKLISPNQVLVKLHKLGIKRKRALALLASIVSRRPGKPTLAPTDDARAELENIADSSFEEEDEDL